VAIINKKQRKRRIVIWSAGIAGIGKHNVLRLENNVLMTNTLSSLLHRGALLCKTTPASPAISAEVSHSLAYIEFLAAGHGVGSRKATPATWISGELKFDPFTTPLQILDPVVAETTAVVFGRLL